MRNTTLVALAVLLSAGLLSSAPAGAVHDQGSSFSIGSRFNIGGLDVALVYGSRGSSYAPYSYYRFPRPVAYRGYRCTDRCFVRGGHYYHDRSCPVAATYFRNHHFDAGHFWARPAPRVYVPTYPPQVRYLVPPGHRKHGRHWVPPGHRKHHGNGHNKHDRGRGHRHGPSCGHRGH